MRSVHSQGFASKSRGLSSQNKLNPLDCFSSSVSSLAAHAQGTPLDTSFTTRQNLFTGTAAKAGSLIAIVVGGYQFAHGEPGAKRAALAGVAAGTGIAVLAANVFTWLAVGIGI
jgi:type IV secretory pathway VirB2 component (pilin)